MSAIDEAFGLNSSALGLLPERPKGCKCTTCRFRSQELAHGGCNYSLITGHCRSVICPRPEGDERHISEFCKVYEEGTPYQDAAKWKSAQRKKKAAEYRKPSPAQLRRISEKAAMECWEKGGTDAEIAIVADRSKSWVCKWRRAECLPANPEINKKPTPKRTEAGKSKAWLLYKSGATDEEMAKGLNQSMGWIKYWRERNKLSPNEKE